MLRVAMLACALLGVPAGAQPQDFRSPDLQLRDQAEVLGDAAETELRERLAKVRRDSGLDFVIATTGDLGGKAADAFAWAIEAERMQVLPKIPRVVLVLSLDPAERTLAVVTTRPPRSGEIPGDPGVLETGSRELKALSEALNNEVTPHLIIRDFEGAMKRAVDTVDTTVAAQVAKARPEGSGS
ncbi:hypothetical protein ACLBKU_15120 [Erythrobacter sp. NE805]|uniref:TPM domain-containing protein n=1 Tax=Erythrobacter sp. NE805 TaxID=3389875 RepID=UPI00396B04CB